MVKYFVKCAGFTVMPILAAGCGGDDTVAEVKGGWRHIDTKQYATMDDVSLLKRCGMRDPTGS